MPLGIRALPQRKVGVSDRWDSWILKSSPGYWVLGRVRISGALSFFGLDTFLAIRLYVQRFRLCLICEITIL